jgi:hypothetical protein
LLAADHCRAYEYDKRDNVGDEHGVERPNTPRDNPASEITRSPGSRGTQRKDDSQECSSDTINLVYLFAG